MNLCGYSGHNSETATIIISYDNEENNPLTLLSALLFPLPSHHSSTHADKHL